MKDYYRVTFTPRELDVVLELVQSALSRMDDAGREHEVIYDPLERAYRKLFNEQLGSNIAKHQQLEETQTALTGT